VCNIAPIQLCGIKCGNSNLIYGSGRKDEVDDGLVTSSSLLYLECCQ